MSEAQALFSPVDVNSRDNVTDWALEQFQTHYERSDISKDDIWEYLYGVMHAPDWRERYRHDLKRSLPRVPFAPDFEAFRAAGHELMELHLNYETCPELEVPCYVNRMPDNGDADPSLYRIGDRMRWGRKDKRGDRSELHVNENCKLIQIPAAAHEYQVSGRSPLEWAVDSLRRKEDKKSKIVDDPNTWHAWAADEDAFELIRHLRRLAYVGVESARIIANLPPSLPPQA